MTTTEIQTVLDQHKLWLAVDSKGQRANLSCANLSCAILCNANMDGAIVSYRGNAVRVKFESYEPAPDK